MMSLTTKQILALQSLKGFGKVTINRIIESSVKWSSIYDEKSFYDFLQAYFTRNKVRATCPTFAEFARAIDYAENVLSKSSEKGISVFSKFDSSYPPQLLETVDETGKSDIPLVIHCRGNLEALKMPGIAIIGTREPTESGSKSATYFASQFAKLGFNIVSGLAIGCDSYAHMGALQSDGVTTAVLAGGLDLIYPKENQGLSDMILSNNGLLLSENPIGVVTNKFNLVARDRIQSALSKVTIVIQTSVKGGTMHAANTTLLAGKRLWVVDYKNPNESNCDGNHLLLTKGARSISSKNLEAEYKSLLNETRRTTCTSKV